MTKDLNPKHNVTEHFGTQITADTGNLIDSQRSFLKVCSGFLIYYVYIMGICVLAWAASGCRMARLQSHR